MSIESTPPTETVAEKFFCRLGCDKDFPSAGGLRHHETIVHGAPPAYRKSSAPRAPRAPKPKAAEADPVVALMGALLDFSRDLLAALKTRHEALKPLRLEYMKLRKEFTCLSAEAAAQAKEEAA